jgi:uncharacterized protein (TIGR02099 family)
VYFVAAAGLLATRYVLLPKLNDWRPNLESYISQTFGAEVRINRLEAQWRGLNPSAKIEGLNISLPGQPAVEIPQLSAVLSWKSLFLLKPIFLDVLIDGLTITLRQAPNGDLSIQGLTLPEMGARSEPLSDSHNAPLGETRNEVVGQASPALEALNMVSDHFNVDEFSQNPTWLWLKQQGQISLINATIIWQNQKRQSPDLVLQNLSVNLQNTLINHRLNIKLTPPKGLSKPIEVSVEVGRLLGQIGNALPGVSDGEIFISVPDVDIQAWQPWVDVPAITGQFGVRMWLELEARKIQLVTLDFAGLGVSSLKKEGDNPTQPVWSIAQFATRIEGGMGTLLAGLPMPNIVSTDFDSNKIIFKLKSTNLHLALPEKVQPPTDILSADLNLSITRKSLDNISIQINQSNIKTADGSVSLEGNWQTSDRSSQGIADLTGQINDLNLPALYRYLPPSTDADAFEWLSHAFKAGVVEQATFSLKGPLSEFPFASGSDIGQFKFTGLYNGLNIDYVPDALAGEKWPFLKGARGTVSIDQDRVSVLANWGQLAIEHADKKYEVGVQNLRVDVESVATNPTVSVVTQTVGAAANYLNIIKYSALASVTPPELSDLTADGLWELPFTVNLLIEKPEDATFDSNLLFKQNNIQYQGMSLAKQLTGQINISQKGIQTQNFAGTVLGGPMSVKGVLNTDRTELLVNGEMTDAGITEFIDSPLMGLLKGQFAYQAKLEQVGSKQIKATFETSLKGTAINLPAPLGKTASTQTPLSFQWLHNLGNTSSLGSIDLKIGSAVKVWGVLSASNASDSTPIFSQMNIGIGREPDKTAKGLSVAAQLNKFDVARWQNAQSLLMQEINRPSTGRSLLPDLNNARLSTPLVQVSDQDYKNVSFALTQFSPNNWSVDLGADTLSGSIRWQTSAGNIQGPVTVHFPKLEIGGSASETPVDDSANQAKPAPKKTVTTESNIWDNDFWRKVEALNIRVDDFVLYGNHVGSLNLNATPQLEERRWKIDGLDINTPHGELKSNGFLQVDGNRGVDLTVKADVKDLGKLLAFVGYPDRIVNGSGAMEAKIDWADFPWSKDPAGLSGSAQVDLKNGVFEHVNSRSARLLEILSLQSLNRFFSLDVNADSTFKSGFPWGSIEGTFVIDKGIVNTQNLIIESPVAEIALVGDTNIVRQDWNVRALVRPQLDFSGTAIATGFVLNPIVGLSALIGQYILKNPIERALQARYFVTGPWDNPKVDSQGVTSSANDASSTQTKEAE